MEKPGLLGSEKFLLIIISSDVNQRSHIFHQSSRSTRQQQLCLLVSPAEVMQCFSFYLPRANGTWHSPSATGLPGTLGHKGQYLVTTLSLNATLSTPSIQLKGNKFFAHLRGLYLSPACFSLSNFLKALKEVEILESFRIQRKTFSSKMGEKRLTFTASMENRQE